MFEPVHGSAPDIAGRQIADPTAAILSTALAARPPRPHQGGRPDRAGGGRRRDGQRRAQSAYARGRGQHLRPASLRREVPCHHDVVSHCDHPHERRPVGGRATRRDLRRTRASGSTSPTTCSSRNGPPTPAGTTPRSSPTARSASTRRARCCTTRRRSSRAPRPTGMPTGPCGRSGPRPTPPGCSAPPTPGAPAAADGRLHRRHRGAGLGRRRLGAGRWREVALPPAVHVRLGGVPRRTSVQARDVLGDLLSGRRVLPRGRASR